MKEHYKLVRDRIFEILEEKGISYESHLLDEKQFLVEISRKVVEEAHELKSAETKEEKTLEVADILETLQSYVEAHGLDWAEVKRVKQERYESRGGFEQGLFLDTTNE